MFCKKKIESNVKENKYLTVFVLNITILKQHHGQTSYAFINVKQFYMSSMLNKYSIF